MNEADLLGFIFSTYSHLDTVAVVTSISFQAGWKGVVFGQCLLAKTCFISLFIVIIIIFFYQFFLGKNQL
jgi:hypothetical protein